MTPATIAAGGLAALALGAGVALGATGVVDLLPDEAMGPLPADLVGYHLCPDEAELGTFVRGDTVLVVGRDEAGEWLQVRSPDDLFERVWVEADLLVPDGEVGDTPVAECDQAEFLAVEPTDEAVTELDPSPSPSPSPSPQASPSPIDAPSPTEPAPPSPTPTPTPTPTQTATPTPEPTTPPPSPSPAPNEPPEMSTPVRQNDEIWTGFSSTAECPTDSSGNRPESSDVSVNVTDDRGVADVNMTVVGQQVRFEIETRPSPGSTWTGTVGPYPKSLFSPGEILTIEIVATDTDGATTPPSETTITVRHCS